MKARSLQFFSLQTKLLLFAAILVLVPGAIYGVVTVSSSRAALARVVGRQLVEAARNAADRLATTLRSERESLESFARQDVMREIRIGDLDKRISSFLTSLKRGCPQCIDLSVLDANQRVVASSDPSLIGSAGSAAFGAGRAGAAIAGPLESTTPGRPGLRFTVVVPDPDVPERAIGSLVALYDWERTTEVIARVRENLVSVGLDADVLILGAGGVVIGGASRPDGRWRRGDAVGLEGSGGDLPEVNGQIDDAAGVLFGHAPLPGDLPGWRILVSQPLFEAFAPVRRTVRLLAAVLAATLLAALTIALAAARRVTRPLAELTDAAQQVGRGRPAPTVPVRSRDEVGALAEAFNRMAVDLRRAERELVDAAKFAFVGELAAGVAHEVRTPLGVLRSAAQLLERSLDVREEEARELLQIVRDEVDRVDRVVSGLLELGRPRELRPEPSPLGQIVFRAADFVEVQAREKGVHLRRRAVEPEPVALCDPELVYQVALNLLVNAIQILAEGQTVELSLLRPQDGYAGFEVRDDGPGIPAEIRGQIFEPFFTHRQGGVGLGLTFVQRVVQEHRGRIAVESADGRGTVFRIELPAARSAT